MEIRSEYQQNIRICYRKSSCAFPVKVATLARQGHNHMQDSIGNGSAPQELHSLSRCGLRETRSISCCPGTGMTTKA